MLVLMLHGWFDMDWDPAALDAGQDEMLNDNLTSFIEASGINAIAVFPVGSGKGETANSTIYAWNAPGNGLNQKAGPKGQICATPRSSGVQYPCFASCERLPASAGCSEADGCNFASCLDDVGFLRLLLAHLLATYCIDTQHVHVAGFSTGGVLAFELGATVPGIASIAAVEAGQMLGFGSAPRLPVHLLDVHGSDDATMPANYSCGPKGPCGPGPSGAVVTDDGFFMEPLANGTARWAAAVGIPPGQAPVPYTTDASTDFHCVQPHGATVSDTVLVVACSGAWGHTWPLHTVAPRAYPALLLEFFGRTPLPPRLELPPTTTQTQASAVGKLTAAAARAADAARPRAVALLNRPGLRSRLADLAPSLAALPGSELLRLWEEQLGSAEIAHGMYAREPAFQLDSMHVLDGGARYLPNQWQLPLTEPRFGSDGWRMLSFYPAEGDVETGWLGLPAFSAPSARGVVTGGWPASLAEASDRPVYCTANQHRLADPTSSWGDVSCVLNLTTLGSGVIISPVDTGDYQCQCDPSLSDRLCAPWTSTQACSKVWCCGWSATGQGCVANPPGSPSAGAAMNCSDANMSKVTSGTLTAAAHLLEPYARAYGNSLVDDRLAGLIVRSLLPWSELPTMPTGYGGPPVAFEAQVVANPPLPAAVAFVVLSIRSLFGTELGATIQQRAAARGWPVSWALGPHVADGGCPQRGVPWVSAGRLLDPRAFLQQTNISSFNTSVASRMPAQAALLAPVWAAAIATRAGGETQLSCKEASAIWANLVATLDSDLFVEPLRSSSPCPRIRGRCIGTEGGSGRCICRGC
jgi:poly(3-hydroxybutyrate) depolymerase